MSDGGEMCLEHNAPKGDCYGCESKLLAERDEHESCREAIAIHIEYQAELRRDLEVARKALHLIVNGELTERSMRAVAAEALVASEAIARRALATPIGGGPGYSLASRGLDAATKILKWLDDRVDEMSWRHILAGRRGCEPTVVANLCGHYEEACESYANVAAMLKGKEPTYWPRRGNPERSIVEPKASPPTGMKPGQRCTRDRHDGAAHEYYGASPDSWSPGENRPRCPYVEPPIVEPSPKGEGK